MCSSSNTSRGCRGFGWMSPTGISRSTAMLVGTVPSLCGAGRAAVARPAGGASVVVAPVAPASAGFVPVSARPGFFVAGAFTVGMTGRPPRGACRETGSSEGAAGVLSTAADASPDDSGSAGEEKKTSTGRGPPAPPLFCAVPALDCGASSVEGAAFVLPPVPPSLSALSAGRDFRAFSVLGVAAETSLPALASRACSAGTRVASSPASVCSISGSAVLWINAPRPRPRPPRRLVFTGPPGEWGGRGQSMRGSRSRLLPVPFCRSRIAAGTTPARTAATGWDVPRQL